MAGINPAFTTLLTLGLTNPGDGEGTPKDTSAPAPTGPVDTYIPPTADSAVGPVCEEGAFPSIEELEVLPEEGRATILAIAARSGAGEKVIATLEARPDLLSEWKRAWLLNVVAEYGAPEKVLAALERRPDLLSEANRNWVLRFATAVLKRENGDGSHPEPVEAVVPSIERVDPATLSKLLSLP
ncbi:MAG: hypothetical protein Q7S00_04875, partial [bacterium]|nr:hypothetical protein [bacterium]